MVDQIERANVLSVVFNFGENWSYENGQTLMLKKGLFKFGALYNIQYVHSIQDLRRVYVTMC